MFSLLEKKNPSLLSKAQSPGPGSSEISLPLLRNIFSASQQSMEPCRAPPPAALDTLKLRYTRRAPYAKQSESCEITASTNFANKRIFLQNNIFGLDFLIFCSCEQYKNDPLGWKYLQCYCCCYYVYWHSLGIYLKTKSFKIS